jgi:multidrug efflux pump subunit AcrA (membrane-fusion protein)
VELLERSSISEALMEQIERDVLRQRTQVQNLENSLALIPSRRDQLVAQQVLAQAQLLDAQRSLANTVIRAPYACRVAARYVVGAEYIRAGTVVAVAHGIERAEVEAQVPIDRLRHLLDADRFVRPELTQDLDSDELFATFGLTAVVRLAGGEAGPQWPARFDRIGAAIDPVTRTSAVIVSVDEPYRDAVPGVRPPLVKGMYCEVELRGEPRRALPVPREAVHEDRVYLVGADDRLEVRQVEVAYSHGELAVISAGLEDGEQVVLSDLVPAIAGTLLKPIADPVVEQRLERYARGEGTVR